MPIPAYTSQEIPMSNVKVNDAGLRKMMTHVEGEAAQKRLEKQKGHVWVKGDDKADMLTAAKGFAASTTMKGEKALEAFIKMEDKALDLNDGQVAALRSLLKDMPEFK